MTKYLDNCFKHKQPKIYVIDYLQIDGIIIVFACT